MKHTDIVQTQKEDKLPSEQKIESTLKKGNADYVVEQ